MWINIAAVTPDKVQDEIVANNFELYAVGHEAVCLTKEAGDAQSTYALAGRLIASKSGWILLEVPNSLVRGAFDALHEVGAELPLKNGQLTAHISVMRPEEIERIGGIDKITERGHFFSYQLGPVQVVEPAGWQEMSKVWFVKVKSPELEKLRKSYGLSALPNEGKFEFHITIAVRRKKVLQENDVKKTAALDVPHHEQEKSYTCGPAALRMAAGAFDHERSEQHFADNAGTTSKDGTPPAGIVEAAKKDGLEAEVKEHMSLADVKKAIDSGKAVILDYQLTDDPTKIAARNDGHYAVAYKYDDEHVYLRDPANKEDKLTHEQLMKRWKDKEASGEQTNRLGIIVWKKEAAVDDSISMIPENPDETVEETTAVPEHNEPTAEEPVGEQGPTLPYSGKEASASDIVITIGPGNTFFFEKYAEEVPPQDDNPLLPPPKHVVITGYSGAGKSTVAQTLAQRLGMPIKKLDEDPDFKEWLPKGFDMGEPAEPDVLAKWRDIKRTAVQRALATQEPHVIEGTQILDAPDLVKDHRRILLDVPVHEVVRRRLLRDRLKAMAEPDRPADRNPGAPGSAAARNRAKIARELIERFRARYEAFKQEPGVEVVPSNRLQQWLAQQNAVTT